MQFVAVLISLRGENMADSFEIELYTVKSAKNKLSKSLGKGKEMSGTLRKESSVMNPSIIIHSNDAMNDKIGQYNYVYIKKFNRYYFITNIQSVRTYIWRIDLHCDVLMSYKEQIKDLDVIVIKQEDDENKKQTVHTAMTNKMIDDGSYKVAVNARTKVIDFEFGTDETINKDDTYYILTVLGGQFL